MHLNRFIIISGLIIVGTSLYTLAFGPNAKTLTGQEGAIFKIMTGGWLFMVALSILDLFGGPLAALASGLALVAVVFVLLNNGFITNLFSGNVGTPSTNPSIANPGGGNVTHK